MKSIKISTEIGSSSTIIGERKTIEYCAKAGFDGWDFSMFNMARWSVRKNCFINTDHPLAGKNYISFSRELKKISDSCGIICNQAHAPYPSFVPEVRSCFEKSLECAAEAGAKILVIHPQNDETPESNAEMFYSLLPLAESYGIKIAVENIFNRNLKTGEITPAACATPDSFLATLNAVKSENFVACLDIGHSEMKGCKTSAAELIDTLGDKLQCLHIHDNGLYEDDHQIPFSMSIDFGKIISALKRNNYRGWFTLECAKYMNSINATNENEVFAGLKSLAESAKKLCLMFEGA